MKHFSFKPGHLYRLCDNKESADATNDLAFTTCQACIDAFKARCKMATPLFGKQMIMHLRESGIK